MGSAPLLRDLRQLNKTISTAEIIYSLRRCEDDINSKWVRIWIKEEVVAGYFMKLPRYSSGVSRKYENLR